MIVDLPAGLAVSYDTQRRDVVLGPDVEAEEWRVRLPTELAPVLPPDVAAALDPALPLYSMINGVYHRDDRAAAARHPWRYELTVLPPLRLGREYVKTLGHIHTPAPPHPPTPSPATWRGGANVSPLPRAGRVGSHDVGGVHTPAGGEGLMTYAEAYEVLLGVAHFVLFRMADEGAGVEDVVVVEAVPGDRVVIPPGYHHLSINPGTEAMVFADLIDRAAGADYGLLRARGGAPYLCVTAGDHSGEGPSYEPNSRYMAVPPPRRLHTRDLPGHTALPALPLYRMPFDTPAALAFLSDPAPHAHLFEL